MANKISMRFFQKNKEKTLKTCSLCGKCSSHNKMGHAKQLEIIFSHSSVSNGIQLVLHNILKNYEDSFQVEVREFFEKPIEPFDLVVLNNTPIECMKYCSGPFPSDPNIELNSHLIQIGMTFLRLLAQKRESIRVNRLGAKQMFRYAELISSGKVSEVFPENGAIPDLEPMQEGISQQSPKNSKNPKKEKKNHSPTRHLRP